MYAYLHAYHTYLNLKKKMLVILPTMKLSFLRSGVNIYREHCLVKSFNGDTWIKCNNLCLQLVSLI